MPDSPRVTVLVPTYNRSARLRRALDSLLAQTFADFRVLISDNDSPDDTQAVCEQYARADPRVTYHRQPENITPVPNFNWLLERSDTEFTLMVADDDWLSRDYIERCLAVMDADPTLAVVTGINEYEVSDSRHRLARNLYLEEHSPSRRTLRYLKGRWSSTAFYGLLRTSAVKPALPIPNVMGADWIFIAGVVFGGRAVTTEDTHLNREQGGASASFQRIAEVSRLAPWEARHPHLAIAYGQFREIAFESPAYARLGRVRRLLLGLAGAAAIVAGHPLDVVWDTFGPIVLHPRVARLTRPAIEAWRAAHPRA
ncbi:MAG TPA: glycosyltransferase family A protein [Solirubrobacteraceae bacterium]|nr:glycosyltransferase family A protein [Solirubrobacteraceae bacterium]